MADFELLSTYITIRTRGLRQVLRDFAQARAAAQRIEQTPIHASVERATNAARRFREFMASSQISMNRLARSGRPLQEQFQALDRIQARLQRRLVAGNLTVQERARLEARLTAIYRRREQLEGQAERRRRSVLQQINSISLEAGFIAPFTRLSGNILRIANSFREMGVAAGLSARGITLAGRAGVVFGSVLAGMQTALNIAAAALRQIGTIALGALRGAFQALFSPTLNFLRLVRQLIANLPILATVIGGLLTRSLIRAGQEFQRISSGFQFAFGAGAQAELSRMIALANQLGVPLEAVTENYVRISSAARDAGIAQEDVRNLMQGVGSAAVALGLDVNRVNGLFFAFEQVISKGRLSSEELRRQIGDRLPGAFAIAARSLGVTTAELDTLLERGAINSADFIRAIGTELNRTFGPQAARQVNRITAVINRLQTQFRLLQIDIASRLEPAFVRVLQRVTDLIRAVRESSAFRAFSAFITQQLLIVEANFDRIVQVVRNWVVDMAPSFQRFARLILVVNTVAIGGFLEAVRRLRPVFDTVLTAIERFITRMTGIEFRGLGANLESVIAVAQAIPAVFDVIELRIRSALNVLRVFTDTFVTTGQVVTAPFRAIHQAVTGIVTGLQLTLDTMLRATGLSDRYAGSTERLAEAMERVRDVTQESFDETRVLRFQRVVENVGRRLDPFRLGIVGAFGSLFAAVERVNAATRETVGLTARAQEQQGGTGSIINITELRGVLERSSAERQQQAIASASQGTERNTGLIATHIAALDRKIGELPDLVETLVRTSVLALPGGGIGR